MWEPPYIVAESPLAITCGVPGEALAAETSASVTFSLDESMLVGSGTDPYPWDGVILPEQVGALHGLLPVYLYDTIYAVTLDIPELIIVAESGSSVVLALDDDAVPLEGATPYPWATLEIPERSDLAVSPPVLGRDVAIVAYVEAQYATPPSFGAPGMVLPLSQWSATPPATWRAVDIVRATSLPLMVRSAAPITLSAETTVHPQTIGFWLALLLGTPTTTGTVPGPWVHRFAGQVEPPSCTVEAGYPNDAGYERLPGTRVSALTIDLTPGATGRLSLALYAARQIRAWAPIQWHPIQTAPTDWRGSELSLESHLSAGSVLSVSLACDRGLKTSSLALLGKPYNPSSSRPQVSGRLTAVLTDLHWLDRALAGEPTSFSVRLQHGNGGGAEGHESLTLTVTDCLIQAASPAVDTEAGLVADLVLTSGTLTAVLVNSRPSVLP